jgi:hypothetical protein
MNATRARPLADLITDLFRAAHAELRPLVAIVARLQPENPPTVAGGWIPETTQEKDR